MSYLLTIVSAYLLASLVEYCLHRFFLHHSPEQSHIKNHHKIFHGIKSYNINDAQYNDIVSSIKYILGNIAFSIPISLIIFTKNSFLAILFFITALIYTLWVDYVHLYYHRGTNNFLEKLPYYKRLREHHKVHHYIYNSNYGIASTIWDIIFRTKRKS